MGRAEDLDLVLERTGNRAFAGPGWENLVASMARRFRGEPPAESPLPSLGRQIAGLAGAAGQVAATVVNGEPLTLPAEAVAARLVVCREGRGLAPQQTQAEHCDRYRPSDDRCGACGCYLAGIVGKATLRAWDCPLGRWPRP